jgi:GNAT superfamily N-acetyltransferase
LSFLGLLPEAIGQGFGRILIQEAIRRAFAKPIERLWLHTCTLDHPAALPVDIAAGLRPYRRAIEIAQDPRLTGELPRDAAPHLPVI